MFSPPPRHAYFHNIELNLRDGTKLELIKVAQPVSSDCPSSYTPRAVAYTAGRACHSTQARRYLSMRTTGRTGTSRSGKCTFAPLRAAHIVGIHLLPQTPTIVLSLVRLQLRSAPALTHTGRWVCREWNSRHRDGKVLQNHKTWLTSYPADTYVLPSPRRKRGACRRCNYSR